MEGHLLVVGSGNVYSVTVDTEVDQVKVRAELLGPLGKVAVKSYGLSGTAKAQAGPGEAQGP